MQNLYLTVYIISGFIFSSTIFAQDEINERQFPYKRLPHERYLIQLLPPDEPQDKYDTIERKLHMQFRYTNPSQPWEIFKEDRLPMHKIFFDRAGELRKNRMQMNELKERSSRFPDHIFTNDFYKHTMFNENKEKINLNTELISQGTSLNTADSATEAWVRHYYSKFPSYDEATAIVTDMYGNIYVTGTTINFITGIDYLTIKYSTTGIEQWVKRYNGPENTDDMAVAIAVDAGGNVYVTGVSGGDYATIKYNSDGVELWVKRYNGPENSDDEATAIAVDIYGNVYVTGTSASLSTYPYHHDYTTIKYNSDGVEQWVKIYNGPENSNDEATAIAVDDYRNVYVTGVSGGDYTTIQYNSDGVERWVKRYNGPGNFYDEATAIAVDVYGNVYVTGVSYSSLISWDYTTIKYNIIGVEQWVKIYNGPGNSDDLATAIAVDVYGNVYVTGESYSPLTSSDYATIKYNSAGIEQWVKIYNGPSNSNDKATAIAVDDYRNVYVTGVSGGDYTTIQYNSAGVEQWVKIYNGPGSSNDKATAIAVDVYGNVYVTGSSDGFVTYSDYATIKYNSDGVEQWVKRYNGMGNSFGRATAIAVDIYGNVYVTGVSYSSLTSWDYATIKYNSAGVEQWVKIYNGPGNSEDEATAIAVDVYGNVYVTGSSVGFVTYSDYATIKYNSDGVEQWVKRYNGMGNYFDRATAIAVDIYGNVYVTGVSYSSLTSSDYTTIKYNSDGVEQWVKIYNGPENSNDEATAIAVDDYRNVYVTGVSGGDYTTIQYNSDGVEQWVKRYNGMGNSFDGATAIAVDVYGNVYVTGSSVGFEKSWDYATIKYNSAGVEQWVKIYNGPGNYFDRATAIAVDVYGNVYVTGSSVGFVTYSDYATIKYNSDGVEQWVKRYNGMGNSFDRATAIAVDVYGNVYVTGSSVGFEKSWDYATIKYNSAGVEQWVKRYKGPRRNSNDKAIAMAIDGVGNVYVTGQSSGFVGSICTTIKYLSPSTSVMQEKLELFQNYPNPFNTVTVISYKLPVDSRVTLRIYNTLGQEIKTLVDNVQVASYHSVEWDKTNNLGNKVACGVYFYRLDAVSLSESNRLFSNVGKMLVMK